MRAGPIRCKWPYQRPAYSNDGRTIHLRSQRRLARYFLCPFARRPKLFRYEGSLPPRVEAVGTTIVFGYLRTVWGAVPMSIEFAPCNLHAWPDRVAERV